MLDLLCIGETMVAFIPDREGPLEAAESFTKTIAGAESNVAVGAARLGHLSGWIGKVGRDGFGRFILEKLQGEGVDISHAFESGEGPTGILFKQLSKDGSSEVFYYRSNSAARTLRADEVDKSYLCSAKILHITGITPALSDGCAAMVRRLAQTARKSGCRISFDPNLRLKLWNVARARKTMRGLFKMSDIVLVGQTEAELLFGKRDPADLLLRLHRAGAKVVALKMGACGALVSDGKTAERIEPFETSVVDTVGAGDAFDAGFLCGLLEHRSLRVCGEMGALMGAMAVSSRDDVDALPCRSELDARLNLIMKPGRREPLCRTRF